MQTRLTPEFAATPEGRRAEEILRACVHCGFCTATCPTYQLLGDELDGPRGRIYQIKQLLEGAPATRSAQLHLDRCLTCRSCETTCPSGVAYGELLDIGRAALEQRVTRPPLQRLGRWLLREGLTSRLFPRALALGRRVKPLLPGPLRDKLTPLRPAAPWPGRVHARRVLMLEGCVQPGLAPNINAATARVLDAVGIEVMVAPNAGCCGAIRQHLGDTDGARDDMRRNIDAWLPLLDHEGIEAIVANASGCGVQLKDYGHALADDPQYAAAAARIAALARDPIELLADQADTLRARLRQPQAEPVAWHPPCTLQHGQRLGGRVEALLRQLGFTVALPADSHLCCGSAGTYSVLQPLLSSRLRERKLKALAELQPQRILSANIGCIHHLQAGSAIPVQHWVEFLDEGLPP